MRNYKEIAIVILIICLSTTTFAQKKKDKKKNARFDDKISFVNLDLGLVTGLLTKDFSRITNDGFNIDYAKSKQLALNYLYNSAKDEDQTISYSIGLGMDFKTYALQNNVNLMYNDSITYVEKENVLNYSKNKFCVGYVQMPIYLKFNKEFGKREYYHLSFGAIPGIKLFSKYQQKYSADNKSYKVKSKGGFNLNPFKLDGTIRIGRNNIGAFFNYNFLALFDKNKHEKLMPFSIGITYRGF